MKHYWRTFVALVNSGWPKLFPKMGFFGKKTFSHAQAFCSSLASDVCSLFCFWQLFCGDAQKLSVTTEKHHRSDAIRANYFIWKKCYYFLFSLWTKWVNHKEWYSVSKVLVNHFCLSLLATKLPRACCLLCQVQIRSANQGFVKMKVLLKPGVYLHER